MVAPIPELEGCNDPRLDHILEKHPKGFKEKICDNLWVRKNKKSIIESIKDEGQVYANYCYKDAEGNWIVGPGQTRWLALHYLKMPTQRVVVSVREGEMEEFEERFGVYSCVETVQLTDYLSVENVKFVLMRENIQRG